jgi:hypothetical protein
MCVLGGKTKLGRKVEDWPIHEDKEGSSRCRKQGMYCSAILPATAVKGLCAVSATWLVLSQLEKAFFRSKTWVYYQYPDVDHGGIIAF